MPEQSFRIERDSMGEIKVPADAYYGAQTQRAVENFPVSGIGFPRRFIRTLALVKYAAAEEIVNGAHSRDFVVDIFQTGSGTSTNMNANEVIANRALAILRKPLGSKAVHPNDHVNM